MFKQQLDKMQREHEEAFKRLDTMDQANRKLKASVQKYEERQLSDENVSLKNFSMYISVWNIKII